MNSVKVLEKYTKYHQVHSNKPMSGAGSDLPVVDLDQYN